MFEGCLNEEFEEWRSLSPLGFSIYNISSLGRIKNVQRDFILSGSDSHGYTAYGLWRDDGKQKFCLGHILVAKSFLGEPKEGETVDHINKIRNDNKLSNIRWATLTVQANNKEKPKNIRGRSVYQLDEDFNIIKKWEKINIAAAELKITRANISRACKDFKTRTCGGFKWMYEEDYEKNDNEIWKIVPYDNVENLYASSEGRIKFCDRILHGYEHGGYLETKIKCLVTGKVNNVKIHKLVSLAFHGKSDLIVDHIDRNKLNNRPSNLEYVTDSENVKRAINLGLRVYKTRKVVQIALDGKIVAEYPSLKEAAEKTGLNSSCISSVCSGRNVQTGGFLWKYA